MPLEAPVPVKKRRFLATDYDFIAEFITKEIQRREQLDHRKSHEILWKEVDRQVHMQAMAKLDVNGREDPDRSWESSLELGDLSTASEVLTADILRLIFPQDRSWMAAHADIEPKRLSTREEAAGNKPLDVSEVAELQKAADAELKAVMGQQHEDFGLRGRIELSTKESLHHGSFVAEAQWDEMQQYSMHGVFKSQAAPVWVPHSMWNCYPEPGELGVNLIYQGSMIIKSEKPLEWIKRQTRFINQKKLDNLTKDKKAPVKLVTYFGDLTIQRKGENVFLPNMKFIVADKRTVIFAEPNDNVTIIYGGYDRVDVRDPYFMSPIIKQSPNQTITTTIVNKFIDNIDLKLDPTVIYDGNDPMLIKMGGPKIGPGRQYPTKGGLQNFQQIDVGDPTWAVAAITYFDEKAQQGTGVSAARTGTSRQADRVTATQIEEEAASSEIRTIDFVGKMEKGIKAFLYIQHEMNRKKLKGYKFYNSEPGMPDFDKIDGKDLPVDVHFQVVGSKGLLTERKRSRATSEVTAFLLGNELTQDIPNLVENAKQMYADAGNKNPELLMNIPGENDKVQQAIAQVTQQFEEAIQELQAEVQRLGQELVKKEMELTNARDQLQLRNERAEGVEAALRDQIKILKANQKMQADYLGNLGKIKDEQDKLQKLVDQAESQKLIEQESDEAFQKGVKFGENKDG